jgi:hypothetical protein
MNKYFIKYFIKYIKWKKNNDENCKLIFLSCILFLIEFQFNQLFRSSSNVVTSAINRIKRHMQRVLRKFHRKKKKMHWLRGM